eukprot:9695879-Heterocapsa_arctica.AAC.1
MVKECGRSPNHKVGAEEGHQGKGVNLTPIEGCTARERSTDNMRHTPGGDRYALGAIGSTASSSQSAIRG